MQASKHYTYFKIAVKKQKLVVYRITMLRPHSSITVSWCFPLTLLLLLFLVMFMKLSLFFMLLPFLLLSLFMLLLVSGRWL
jgi:hypothetical protein